ncbi:hypothetical protein [Aequorivita marisscotiae]|uniref:Uncharacterized protein n=1 Tax=Aequorivita marisscotiae TaxID=3040348 RepID=A0ABY8KYP4_9FLAO|nr:hypothetical protein [Aequorivita sp. Ant34-E75]WGF93185.1 hypothetical protein QCQ61_03125 [Aequorivita sp. Ant34-E75]
MKTYNWIVLGVLLLIGSTAIVHAQNVNIVVPAQNIFNGTEFLTVQTVMNATNGKKWDKHNDPAMWATSSQYFSHTSHSGVLLPNSVLHWQFNSIGGEDAPLQNKDGLPGFQTFTMSPQAWYYPHPSGRYNPGNITFKFKMPASVFLNNTFVAGNYTLAVTQNYDGDFTPVSFNVIISVPKAIWWLTANNSVYRQINSLNQYRSGGTQVQASLGDFVIGNTVDFKLFGKSASSTIQFTSSKGVEGTRNIAIVNLGGDNLKINTLPLSNSWKDFTASDNFNVESDNRNSFQLKASVSKEDLKTHFYEAGTYKFQINLNANSTDNSTASPQNIDFTINVVPLSEITIPTSGNAVNFEFNTIAQYQDGQTKTIANQLMISNNETYELNVKTDAPFFRKSGVQSDVPSSILQVGIEGGSSNVALSTTSQKIINNGTPVLDESLNIKYTISASAAQSLVAKEKNTYSINVIYSFIAL